MKFNKIAVLQLIVLAHYIFFFSSYIFSEAIWYDDAHELIISKVSLFDFNSIERIADHHLGFSIILKLVLFFFSVEKIYIVLSIIFIICFMFTGYYVSLKLNDAVSILIAQLIFLSSANIINFSFRPKQYIYELIIGILIVTLLKERNYNLNKILTLSLLCFIFSNLTIIYFIFPFFTLIKNYKFKIFHIIYILILGIFGYNAFTKLFNINFINYWSDYHSSSIFDFSNLLNLNLLFFRDFLDTGQLILVVLIVFSGLVILYVNERELFFLCFTPYVAINFLVLLNLYPLGAGRTSIILFPLIFYSIFALAKSIQKIRYSNIFLIISVLILSINLIDDPIKKSDYTKEILDNLKLDSSETVYISYYSIPQIALFSDDLIDIKHQSNRCLYEGRNNVILLQKRLGGNSCKPMNSQEILQSFENSDREFTVIGQDSKTQNILSKLNTKNFQIVKETFGQKEFIITVKK